MVERYSTYDLNQDMSNKARLLSMNFMISSHHTLTGAHHGLALIVFTTLDFQ